MLARILANLPLRLRGRDETSQSHYAVGRGIKSRTGHPPLGKGGGSVRVEIIPSVEMAFPIEMVVDRSVDGGELVRLRIRPALWSSHRMM